MIVGIFNEILLTTGRTQFVQTKIDSQFMNMILISIDEVDAIKTAKSSIKLNYAFVQNSSNDVKHCIHRYLYIS